MKKTVNNRTDSDNSEMPKQKERHIVSWSQEEDDILREQIRINGTENWTIIASKFKDKTTRQCRRRWFTYLNTDFKKGGWSPEEDMLLCEAQKIFGNRWTEIAKVVSGRTDNAVKNRFTTLCKKRAKQEALAKENKSNYINLYNKRVIFPDGLNTDGRSEATEPFKKLRSYISENSENLNKEQFAGEFGIQNHQIRPPFAVIAQETHSCEVDFSNQLPVRHINEASIDRSINDKTEGTFLKKDNRKVLALMQQAELLSSLAIKVNSEMTDQSLENAWMVLEDFLKQNKESDQLTSRIPDIDFQLEKYKELVENLRSSNESNTPFSRDLDMYESSPACSEYSSGSSLLCNAPANEICLIPQKNGHELQSNQLENGIFNTSSTNEAKDVLNCDETKGKDGGLCEYSNTEFSSPHQVTPLFGSLAAAIPTPTFSESEKHFLMKTLGMESNSPNAITNPSQHHPSCKRSLLHSL